MHNYITCPFCDLLAILAGCVFGILLSQRFGDFQVCTPRNIVFQKASRIRVVICHESALLNSRMNTRIVTVLPRFAQSRWKLGYCRGPPQPELTICVGDEEENHTWHQPWTIILTCGWKTCHIVGSVSCVQEICFRYPRKLQIILREC